MERNFLNINYHFEFQLIGAKQFSVNRNCSIILFLILLTFFFNPATAQDVAVSAQADTNAALIGDQIQLKLEVEHAANTPIVWPNILDTINQFEVLNRSKIDTITTADKIIQTQNFSITTFDSGYYVIKPFLFQYKSPDKSSWDTIKTDPLLIMFHTVPIDTAQAIKAIKAPMAIPILFAEVLPYLIGGVALILIIFLIIYYLKKRKKKPIQVIKPKKPARPPYEVALGNLKALENQKLWQKGEVKEYYVKLSDIIRTYIEDQFQVLALESTTDEIMKAINLKEDMFQKLFELLTTSDLAKFAKIKPLPDENEKCIKYAYGFVEKTKPKPIINNGKQK